jgi:hypothetical protein
MVETIIGGISMDKVWISRLADDVEAKHGIEVRQNIFGDINGLENSPKAISSWFDNFTRGMDELDDKEFLQQMMVKHCPCGGDDAENGKIIKEFYDKSKTLDEFIKLYYIWLRKMYNDDFDAMELRGNVLYLTKPPGGHKTTGSCGKGCHCFLAKETEKYVSDIFCYCCTIGHTGKPYQYAFGNDIKMEFIESVICGGKSCIMTVHLPEKE